MNKPAIVPLPDEPVFAPERLINFRARAQALLARHNTQLVVAFIGDSWVRGAGWPSPGAPERQRYFMPGLCAALQAIYGDAGGGWCGLGDTVSNERRGGSANPERLYQAGTGAWTTQRNNRPVPDICTSVSDTAGDSIRITCSDGPTSAVTLFFMPGGTIEYRWNQGPWTSLSLDLSLGPTVPPRPEHQAGVDSAEVASLILTGFPREDGWTLDLRVVSGVVELAGIEHRNLQPGIRLHNLGAGGSTAGDWSAVASNGWRAALDALGPHTALLLFGTNDQKRVTPMQHRDSLAELVHALRLVAPDLDIGLVTPPDSGDPTPPRSERPMRLYRDQARALAAEGRLCHIDLQPVFGEVESYRYGGTEPLLNESLIHPSIQGSRLITACFLDFLDLRALRTNADVTAGIKAGSTPGTAADQSDRSDRSI
jgi:hypothetical protein